jgi:ubiquinone/menaquinone biosynthesis C-methylase UbiE
MGPLMDAAAITARERELWSQGDYSVVSGLLEPAAAELCRACAVSAGQEVLDVAAGHGNFALACAREGAAVVASDISPRMVEQGRARTDAEGYGIEWVEADAQELPFEDGRFDCVGSVFGAVIAPRPRRAAEELFRVVRQGGTVGMTAWAPHSFMAELFPIGRRYGPPADPDRPNSLEWGHEHTVAERLEGLADRVQIERRALEWTAESPEALAAQVGESAPPWQAAKRAMPPDRYGAMLSDVVELAREHGGTGPTRIEAEYVVIVARRPG